MTKEDILYMFEERAGILEFDGGYTRPDAERLAKEQLIELYPVFAHVLRATCK